MRALVASLVLLGAGCGVQAQTCMTSPFMTMCSNGFSAFNFAPGLPPAMQGGFIMAMPPMQNGFSTFSRHGFSGDGGMTRWNARETVNPDGGRTQIWESVTTFPDGTERRNVETRVTFPDGRVCTQNGPSLRCS